MKNKKVRFTVIFSAVCAVVILAVLVIGHQTKSKTPTSKADPGAVCSFDSLEEAVKWAGFSLKCSDRLHGILATDYSADQTAITVTYGKAGYIRKALISEDTEKAGSEESGEEDRIEQEVNGLSVWLIGGKPPYQKRNGSTTVSAISSA